jgi:hypothetical protein
MNVATGQGADSQWFDYKPSYFMPTVRIEWDKGTKFAALPPEAANYLITHGYARPMTDAEIEAYTAPELPKPKLKKGERHDSSEM